MLKPVVILGRIRVFGFELITKFINRKEWAFGDELSLKL